MSLDTVRYAQVWEDHDVLEAALLPGPEDDVVSIGSAGCNALALLARGPRRVVAIDMSPAQIALLELKVAGISHLCHGDFAVLVGAREGDRGEVYDGIRPHLPASAREYWDARPEDVALGVMHAGRLERFIRAFQREHLYRLHPRSLVDRLLLAPDLGAQREAFAALATPEFRQALSGFTRRDHLASRGRDAAQMRYVGEQDTGRLFLERFTRVATAIPTRGNFYLEYVMTGGYADLETGPPYLRPAVFASLPGLLPRLTVVQDEMEAYLEGEPPGSFSKANLSDVFEYMSEEATEALLARLCARMRPGGRIAYWNLFVPRSRPAGLADRLRPLTEEAAALFARDRAWFYGAFHVEEVS